MQKPRNKQSRLKKLLILLALLAGLGLIGYACWTFWQQYKTTHNPKPVVTRSVITHSTETPDETKPTEDCSNYKVDGHYPERISIPTIGVDACIERASIDQHGAIAVPDNIYTTAWYVHSELPGQPGLSVIDGHISGFYNKDGVFQHLDQLKPGDAFTVELGSGEVLNYRVKDERSVPLGDAVEVLLAHAPTTESQLNLITCGGEYDKKTKLYDHRIIVSAALVRDDE